MTDSHLEQDSRWRRLHDRDWTCSCCGAIHRGLFALGCDAPDYWSGDQDVRPNTEVRGARHILTEDFCVIDAEHFFARCVLELPIAGSRDSVFSYGVWTSLSAKNFHLYLDHFGDSERAGLGPWFGWFSNRLSGYPETLNLKCMLHPQKQGRRPLIELEPTDHPLSVEQREGVTFDRVLEIYAVYGHDLRTVLSD